MTDILFGILIGIGVSYIARLCLLAYRKLRLIIKDNRENRRYFYGLSKGKRKILDKVIYTYSTTLDRCNALNAKDKSIHHDLLDMVQNLKNKTMQTASAVGGDSGVKYVKANTHIMCFDLENDYSNNLKQ